MEEAAVPLGRAECHLTIPMSPQISPDGSLLAYTLQAKSKKDLHPTADIWLKTVDDSSRQFTSGDTFDHHPKWSPDGSQIAFLSDRANRGFSQLYLIAVNGGEAKALTSTKSKRNIETFSWSPNGGFIAFTSPDEPTEDDERREKERDDTYVYGENRPYNRLRLLSLASREVETIASGDFHITELAWHPRGTEIAYIARQTPALTSMEQEHVIKKVSLAGGASEIIGRTPITTTDLTWSHDGHSLFYITSLSKILPSSNTIFRIPAQGGEAERIAGGETNCAFTIHPIAQEHTIAFRLNEGLDAAIYVQNVQTGALTKLYAAPGQAYLDWHIQILSDNTFVLAVTQSSGEQPEELWAGSLVPGADNPRLKQLTTHNEPLSSITFGHQEAFYWTAANGLKLDGLLTLPPNAPRSEPLPLVVLVHGGPYGRWDNGFHMSWGKWTQWLALAGYAVLMPNPRGGMGHGDTFALKVYEKAGYDDFGDVMAAVDAAIERGIADPARLAIGGWSYGGYMSAWAVTQTDRFKAAIIGAGVTDWGMMYSTGDLPNLARWMGGSAPWEGHGPHPHAQNSPISFAKQVKTPILLIHGESDERVPLNQAIGFHRALLEHDVPVQFISYPREPHAIAERNHQLDLLRRVRSWYDRWLHV
ncbi:MAG TPA: S9 family peptidase [Ktedonobacteraceae bacterium]|nr:S9 family peptidase [Ktedonobacteraceae bacterium]